MWLCSAQWNCGTEAFDFAQTGFLTTWPARWSADNFPLSITAGTDSVNVNSSLTNIQRSENIGFYLNAYFSSLSTHPHLLLKMRNESKIRNHNCLPPASLRPETGLTDMGTTWLYPIFPELEALTACLSCTALALYSQCSHNIVHVLWLFFICPIIPHYTVTPSEAGTVYHLNSTAPGTHYGLNKHSLNEWVWQREVCHTNELRDSRNICAKASLCGRGLPDGRGVLTRSIA